MLLLLTSACSRSETSLGTAGAPAEDAATGADAATGGDAASSADAAPDATVRDAAFANACEAVIGQTFISKNDLPIGENASGTVYGRWILVFTSGAVCWGHDDALRDDGTLTCDGWTLHAQFSTATHSGSYAPTTGVLTWAGEDYVVRTTEKPGHLYCGTQ